MRKYEHEHYVITETKDGKFTLTFWDDFNDSITQTFDTIEKAFSEIRLRIRLKKLENNA